jgi:flagellar FliJ protein
MKGFSFRLEKVLNYRKNLEKIAQRDLFNARNEYISKEKTIDLLKEKRTEIARECGRSKANGIDVPMYHAYGIYVIRLDRDLEAAYIDLEKAGEEVNSRVEILREKSKGKTIMETLREAALNTYIDSVEKEEQKILDELAIMGRVQRT